MFYLPLFFGEKKKPFLMEFLLNKNHGIRWLDLMSLNSSIHDSKRKMILVKKFLKNLKDCSQFVLNLNTTVYFSTKNSTITGTFISIIGFRVGLEQTNLQREYLMCMSKLPYLLKIDCINFM